MTELTDLVASLKRPALLISAARAGLGDYNRSRDLKRLFRTADAPAPARAVADLLAEEEHLERIRRDGSATYSFIRHIEVLIAMMSEVRLLARPHDAAL